MKRKEHIFDNLDFKRFYSERDKVFVEAIQYSANVLAARPDSKIYIGTDSQNFGAETRMVTAIAYLYPNNGVHVIYLDDLIPRIKDDWTRLWHELERTREVVHYLTSNSSIQVYQVDLDYNQDAAEFSNKLIAAGKGMFEGLGYRVGAKPDQLVATRAADYYCREGRPKRRKKVFIKKVKASSK